MHHKASKSILWKSTEDLLSHRCTYHSDTFARSKGENCFMDCLRLYKRCIVANANGADSVDAVKCLPCWLFGLVNLPLSDRRAGLQSPVSVGTGQIRCPWNAVEHPLWLQRMWCTDPCLTSRVFAFNEVESVEVKKSLQHGKYHANNFKQLWRSLEQFPRMESALAMWGEDVSALLKALEALAVPGCVVLLVAKVRSALDAIGCKTCNTLTLHLFTLFCAKEDHLPQ